MRAVEPCYSCIEKLAYRVAELIGKTESSTKKTEALEEGISYLEENFSTEWIPANLAGNMQSRMKEVSGCSDPFQRVKDKEMQRARQLSSEFHPQEDATEKELIEFAVKGNSVDFFVDLDKMREQITAPVNFFIDDTGWFLEKLHTLKDNPRAKLLYFADNAGEYYFDLPLLGRLQQYTNVYYVIKEKPIQNDISLEEVNRMGLNVPSKIVSTGTDTPGLYPEIASAGFMELYREADLILAKGMGNYETLPDLSLPAPALLLFKAKCMPVAESIGVPLDSYVAAKH